MSEPVRQLAIGEVAARAGMSTSRIRYYEGRGVLPEPERTAGQRRYSEDVFRRLAIIDAAQRVGFTLEEIRNLLGSRDQPAHERHLQLCVDDHQGRSELHSGQWNGSEHGSLDLHTRPARGVHRNVHGHGRRRRGWHGQQYVYRRDGG